MYSSIAMSSKNDILKTPPKALAFDVFGTVVDWRKTVTSTLIHSAAAKPSSFSRSAALSPEVRVQLSKLTDQDWGQFAQEWRNSYKKLVREFVPGETERRDIDTHHHASLIDLLKKWNLEGLYTKEEVEELSLVSASISRNNFSLSSNAASSLLIRWLKSRELAKHSINSHFINIGYADSEILQVWHYLDPWTDSSAGLQKLGTKFITSTLSNGNQSLLRDLDKHGDLGFKKLQSSADFKAYKPHPSVYKGAAKAMGLEPGEVAMVAAHLSDLKAARGCGFKTIYVERKQEEDWKHEQEYEDAKTWVEMWVTEEEDGLLEVARRFGIS